MCPHSPPPRELARRLVEQARRFPTAPLSAPAMHATCHKHYPACARIRMTVMSMSGISTMIKIFPLYLLLTEKLSFIHLIKHLKNLTELRNRVGEGEV